MLLKNALKFELNKGFVKGDLAIKDGRIVDGNSLATADKSEPTYDLSGLYLIPGLTDVHFHGCVGADFSDADPEGLKAIIQYEMSRGITQVCPTGMTLTADTLKSICQIARNQYAKGSSTAGADIVGINLEGPFLSPQKKGAQNADWLQLPNYELWQELQSIAEGLIKIISIAPELDGALDFIAKSKSEVISSIAHTVANYAQSQAAIQAGARHVTHLFNAMPPFGHREPGVIGAALDNPHLTVELITDGIHTHPTVVRAAFKLFGSERIVMVSDSMRATGLADGNYSLGGQAVIVKNNKATLHDGTIAGSVCDLMACLKSAISFGIDPYDAVLATTYNPARLIGVDHNYGSLDLGKIANLVVLNAQFEPQAVLMAGKIVAGDL